MSDTYKITIELVPEQVERLTEDGGCVTVPVNPGFPQKAAADEAVLRRIIAAINDLGVYEL